uniref:Zinc finger ZZ-type and EF-hand domain containing 1 n=1 Tax=Callorhinchus milii TaxID=7868 RepID=A0A4W3IYQ1_CALMI
MGNADSAGAEQPDCAEEEDEEEEEAERGAGKPAAGFPASGSGGGAGPDSEASAPALSLNCGPGPEALLQQHRLREAAARVRDEVAENVVQLHHSHLIRWLEERMARGEESIRMAQFCDLLATRFAIKEECEEAFAQFDAEGDGIVAAENMLESLKTSGGANLQGELSHVIRQLQGCSLTPGFVDIFSKNKDRVGVHAAKILRFLHRNRIPSSAIPFPLMDSYNNICAMRSSVLKDSLKQLLEKKNDLDKLKLITKCYTSIEASSNSTDIDKMTNGETSSYWQSDGSSCSHWIRLRLKPDVVLKHLSVAVAASDQSYMPQQVTVSLGRNPSNLQEVRDVRIPSNMTGYVTLLENANASHPFVQINIKRCHGDGCDTRIHGLKTMGHQVVKKPGVSVSDASAIWYLSLLTTLVTVSIDTNPDLAQDVLQFTQKALNHMPPLSLTPSSTDLPSFMSANVLEKVDVFLVRIASCCAGPQADLTLLAFALARGSIAKVMTSLLSISDRLDTLYDASSLLAPMATVRLNQLHRYGEQPHRVARGHRESGFLSESGQTRVSFILSSRSKLAIQVTQIRVKVHNGAKGAKCGLVFAYNDKEETFDAEKHLQRFEKYNKWKLQEFRQFCTVGNHGAGDPVCKCAEQSEGAVGFRCEQCDTIVDVSLQFLMVKFLCPRQEDESNTRIGIKHLTVRGYLRPANQEFVSLCEAPASGLVSGQTLLLKTLYFIQQLAQDVVQLKERKSKQRPYLDFSDLSLKLFWDFYKKFRENHESQSLMAQTILLQLLQNCLALLSGSQPPGKTAGTKQQPIDTQSTQDLYTYLCNVVDVEEYDTVPGAMLKKEAINTVLSGAAIFFPDVQTRRNQLFKMMKTITEPSQPQSTIITFQSLCHYFSNRDPSGLLQLPQEGVAAHFDISPVMMVMDTLLLVATRECELMVVDSSFGKNEAVLVNLLWALQGHLLSWCYLQLKGNDVSCHRLMDGENLEKSEEPVFLRMWTMESAHNYENNSHETTVFVCPGATFFQLEFDEKCETEKRYDYLEFTDSRGVKVRYDGKVGTEKWPTEVTFKSGPRLQFLFHSDNCNNEWGYKFVVKSYGLPDVRVPWVADLQLLVSRLMGRLASQTMALKSTCGKSPLSAKIAAVVESRLWRPILRHGVCPPASETPAETINPAFCPSAVCFKSNDDIRSFLVQMALWDPSQEDAGSSQFEPVQRLINLCKKQSPKSEAVSGFGLGSTVDRAVNGVFAAMLYHTPDLYTALHAYVASGGSSGVSEEMVEVYSLAEGMQTWIVSFLISPETLELFSSLPLPSKNWIGKSLLLLKFAPLGTKLTEPPMDARRTDVGHLKEAQEDCKLFTDAPASQAAPPPKASQKSTEPLPTASKSQQVAPSSPKEDSSVRPRSESQGSSTSTTPSENPVSPHTDLPSPFNSKSKPAFAKGKRLRLLSLKSMEEFKMVPIQDKYPTLKKILGFMKDSSISSDSVVQVLSMRKAQAKAISEVLKVVSECLHSLGQPHLFQFSCVLFLQEVLACQKELIRYLGRLEGCGKELWNDLRQAYYSLVLLLVKAVRQFNPERDGSLLPALSCVQTCLLHLLDMGWEPQDMSFFVDVKLPDLLLAMSQENISVHDSAIDQWSEEDEIADYECNKEWMEECQDGIQPRLWYEKVSNSTPEEKRRMHMFVARYCDLLNVEISCDGCHKIAPWHRYRCLQCPDMDLCKTCFLGGVMPEHHEDCHRMVNMEYACDHCQGLIIGRRINCNVCDDFDLCYGCYSAKKYPDSHLPGHSITVFPMVTIRISDRHRLIQPYIHNYTWLLFSALALYTAHLVTERESDEEELNPKVLSHTEVLEANCTQLITEYLLKAHRGKSKLWGRNGGGPFLASEATLASIESIEWESVQVLDVSAAGGEATDSETCKGAGISDSDVSNQGAPSSSAIYSPVPGARRDSPERSGSASSKQISASGVSPGQDQVFAECSQERILGLLAAMLPTDSASPLLNLRQVLGLLFRVVMQNAGHLNETYHLTLGLLGQLLLRIPPHEADRAVKDVLFASWALLGTAEGGRKLPGWMTTQVLFSLGAVCLDSRISLDWACSVADILRDLNCSPQWQGVTTAFTEHCIRELPFRLKRTNIFTLLVLVGFPEVLCRGTRTVYIDNANELHDVIVLKHFTEKNQAVVIDIKTRKRKTVRDYQLTQVCEPDHKTPQAQLTQYLQHFMLIYSHLLQTSLDGSCPDAVEATWVQSLALKGLYKTMKKHGIGEIHPSILQSGLIKLLVKKCTKGTGFSKLWLLRDLETLSIMLYSSKKEISSVAEVKDSETEEKAHTPDPESKRSNSVFEVDETKPDPLEGLDEATKICFQITHDALNAPLHILRAMFELQMRKTDSFFLEVQKRFDGHMITTDETIQSMSMKWQPSKAPPAEEHNTKAVDTDMMILPCVSKPVRCEKAMEEPNPVTQKLITNTESDLQLSFAKQRRTKSSVLLHKELDARSKKAVRDYLYKVNEAIAVLYARHVLASLLADWPPQVPITEEALGLSCPSHVAYILDLLMQLEEKPLWEKILQKVLLGCSGNMLGSLAVTACQFMEEPGMDVQVRESKHPYENNSTIEDKVHIPGAIYLSVKFDPHCVSEDGCDELLMSSSGDFKQDRHTFSGSSHKWIDFDVPGDTLHYRFTSDMDTNDWGYRFTVTGGHRGRFLTGFEILRQMLQEDRVLQHLPIAEVWEWQVGVACQQLGHQRLKAVHLLLRILQSSSHRGCDLTLLKPLWQLFTKMESHGRQEQAGVCILPPLHRALTELFFTAENRAVELGVLQDYFLALTTEDHIQRCALQVRTLEQGGSSLSVSWPQSSR